MRELYDVHKLFSLAQNDLFCNTSYPYQPDFFKAYLSKEDIMKDVEHLSFYFHIPFCKTLCKFCEYTRFLLENHNTEQWYLDLLEEQVVSYLTTHKIHTLYGLDIGGGTPSCLSEKGLQRLFSIKDLVTYDVSLVEDFDSSFEFNYETITDEKISLLAENGISRVSTGIQIYDNMIMKKHNRRVSKIEMMAKANEAFREKGIKKINLDIMYGFTSQTDKMLEKTLEAIKILNPDHVTVYEMRYNMNQLPHETVTRESLYHQYEYLYYGLLEMNYQARFGQNTFSKYKDEGVSSYLRYRMKKGIPYKGMGISAQSMSHKGITYNSLKSYKSTTIPKIKKIKEEDVYKLPPEEIVAKYISIALYNGCFDCEVVDNILGLDTIKYYYQEFAYLLEKEYIEVKDEMVFVTKKGFQYYGAIASLFWSNLHQKQFLQARQGGIR